MPSFNKVIIAGNLTRDPELRTTSKGTAICQFGVAVSREFKDDAGQKREEATFVDIEAWGKQAEVIAKYCAKGRPILIEGRLKLDQWEDKQTQQKRSKLKVILESFQFLGGREGAAPSGDSAEQGERPGAPAGGRPAPAPQRDINDEDVPF
jgi:single-strand DNA-binding protein